MIQISQNSFAPKYSGHCYNFGRESGLLIRYIQDTRSKKRPFIMASEHEAISDAVAGYVSSMIPSLLGDDASVY